MRLLQRSDIASAARISHDAFNDPNNTTPDEISQILNAEPSPSSGEEQTREQKLEKRVQEELELFDAKNYAYVGAFYIPPFSSSPSANQGVEVGTGEDFDSSTLPEGSVLAGFAAWTRITPSTPLEGPAKRAKAEKEPNLLNNFFAKMWSTRESIMANKTYWFLKLLTIDPPHQRRGIGTLLVKWGVEKANKEGVDAWLESSPMGKGAYLKAGFRVLGMDRVEEKKAKRGYVEWPYMIHEYKEAAGGSTD